MYRKSPGRIRPALALLVSLTLLAGLAGCTPVQPENVEQPRANVADPNEQDQPTVAIYPTLTAAPAFMAGCTNVKSAQFNIGSSVGNRICLEGIIDKIDINSQTNRATIEFDTSTGKTAGSLYSVTILIQDTQSFGLDTLTQLVQGERIAVSGLFGTGSSMTYVAAYVIEPGQASDLIILN